MIITNNLKSYFLSRYNLNKLSKQKYDEAIIILIKIYKENFNNLSDEFLRLTLGRSIGIILDNIIFSNYSNFIFNEKKIFLAKSTSDLFFTTDQRMTLHNINYLSNKYDKEKIEINFQIIEKKENKNNNFKFLLANRLFNIFKKKVFFDFANIKLYLNFVKKGQSPQYLIKDEYFFNTESKLNEHLRAQLFEKSKTIYKSNVNMFKYISIKDLYLIFSLMPLNLVENFSQIYFKTQKKADKNVTKIILTQMMNSDQLNFWVANQKLKFKSSIEIVQHGAGYFFVNYDNNFEYEMSISDRFYSWTNPRLIKTETKDLKQIALTKTIKKNKNYKNDILLISSDWQYFLRFASAPTATLIERNWKEQIKFIRNINFTKKIKIKNPNYYYDDSEEKKKHFYQLKKYMSNENLYNLVENSKITLCSYIGTPFFELMSNDIPFLTFSRMSDNLFSVDAKIYLKKLKTFGFLHYSGKSASDYINNNYENILNIWDDKAFIEFRNEFRENFCLSPKNWQKKFLD